MTKKDLLLWVIELFALELEETAALIMIVRSGSHRSRQPVHTHVRYMIEMPHTFSRSAQQGVAMKMS